MVASLIFGKIMHLFNKKHFLYIGIILASLSTLSFGLLDFINHTYLLLVLGFTIRFILGFTVGIIGTIIYGLVPVLYPDTVEWKMAYMQVVFNFASIAGSLVGGILYKLLTNYELPFFIIAFTISIIGLPIIYNINIRKEE